MADSELTAPEVTSVPGTGEAPSFEDVAPEAFARLRTTEMKRGELRTRETLLDDAEGDLALRREQGLKPLREDLERSIASPMPNAPTLQPIPEAPSGPIIDPEKFQDFGKIAFPFMMLLGKAMRADGVQALNALSHSVQGYTQGRKEEAAQQFKVFQEKTNAVLAQNKQKLDEYKAVMNRRDIDVNQKLQLLEIAAQKYDDAGAYYAAQRKSISDVYKHLEQEDKASMTMARESAKITKDYQDAIDKRSHYNQMENIAREKIQGKITSGKGDAQSRRKLQWIETQQVALLKDFTAKMSALTTKVMPESSRKLAEQQLRHGYAANMKYLNDIARAEGFQVKPELEAYEHPENDPLGPSSSPASEQETKSWRDGIVNFWKHTFGTDPGVNAGVTPSQRPAPMPPPPGNGGVVDFNSLPK